MKAAFNISWILLFFSSALSFLLYTPTLSQPLSDEAKKKIVYDMYDGYKNDFKDVNDISPSEAMDLMKRDKVIFVDTRRRKEMAVSMLPDAMTQKAFLKNPKKYENRMVIVYCTISYRSGKFARKLAERNIRVFNLKGGLLAWVLEGGKVYDKNGETRRIHVYGRKWNYTPENYETFW
jgi:sodium/bile acid cotransporter 7